MNYEAIAYAMMAEGHCAMLANLDLFNLIAAGSNDPNLLTSEPVTKELSKLASKFESMGKRSFCQHIWELYGTHGSKLAGLVSR